MRTTIRELFRFMFHGEPEPRAVVENPDLVVSLWRHGSDPWRCHDGEGISQNWRLDDEQVEQFKHETREGLLHEKSCRTREIFERLRHRSTEEQRTEELTAVQRWYELELTKLEGEEGR